MKKVRVITAEEAASVRKYVSGSFLIVKKQNWYGRIPAMAG